MLREMPAERFWEWVAYHRLHPFGSAHEDRRVAILAEIMAAGGGVKLGERTPITVDTYLDMLHRRNVKHAPEAKQSVQEMETYLNTWVTATNVMIQEEAHMPLSQRTIK